ncbi:hypothetical protein ACIOHO_15625 [Streptomyces sp. NPDC087849]|uniref:hypothetical protein n=1 Tax=Streptomyces sp. NPDC087849 TaxID=3365808 RepID=UPI0038063657
MSDRAPSPLTFLDHLEHDWAATRQATPGRDRRLDALHDEALIALATRAGMTPVDASRVVHHARRTLDGDTR